MSAGGCVCRESVVSAGLRGRKLSTELTAASGPASVPTAVQSPSGPAEGSTPPLLLGGRKVSGGGGGGSSVGIKRGLGAIFVIGGCLGGGSVGVGGGFGVVLIVVLGGGSGGVGVRGFGGSIGGLVAGAGGSLTLSGELGVLLGCQGLGLGTVEVEPPVADEVVLVEDGSVGAEETVLGESALTVSSTDVEDLAFSLRVSVVT